MVVKKTNVEDKPKKVNGKEKGNVFERKIAKIMTEWTGIKFERVPASGGLHWKKDNRVYGDIVCNDPEFPLVIECKNRQAWSMDALITGSAEVKKWWQQVKGDAEATGKKPVVIFTRNQRPVYVMVYQRQFDNLFMRDGIGDHFKMNAFVDGDKVTVVLLDDLVNLYRVDR